METKHPIVRPMLLAAILAMAAGALWAAAVSWCAMIVEQARRQPIRSQDIVVRVDGTPFVRTYESQYTQEFTYQTVEGKQVSLEADQWLLAATLSRTSQEREPLFGTRWIQRILSFSDFGKPATFWYFVHTGTRDGTGHFEGYDSRTFRKVGYIGGTGFRSDEPLPSTSFSVDGRLFNYFRGGYATPTRPGFPATPYWYGETRSVPGRIPQWIVYLLSAGQVVEVDLRKRSIRTVMEDPAAVSIGLAERTLESGKIDNRSSVPQNLCVRLTDRMVVIDSESGNERVYGLPDSLQSMSTINLYELQDEQALLVYSEDRPATRTANQNLCWINSAGQILRQVEWVIQSPSAGPFEEAFACFLIAAAVPAPIANAITFSAALPAMRIAQGKAEGFVSALSQTWAAAWPAMLVSLLVSAGLACVEYRRQKRYAQPWTRTWTVFILLGGLPALVGYLVHRRWPVLDSCPACRSIVPHDRDICSHCQAEFPSPPKKGIEVFAS